MKKFLSIVLLVSALNMQAMEKKQSPQQKKRETSEELLRKAAERLAEEQKEAQEKLASEQKDELKEAFVNLWDVLKKKSSQSFTTLKKEIDTRIVAMLNEENEPCTISDNKVTKELGVYWTQFSAWVDEKQAVSQEDEEVVLKAQPVGQAQLKAEEKPLMTDEEISDLCAGLKSENIEFFKSMIKAPGFTADQLDGFKKLIDELKNNQIQ